MQTDVIIIGQGICGTMLSWFLHKAGKSFVVLDDARPNGASRVAAGIINPVTGRRFVYSWLIDKVMPYAVHTYEEMGRELSIEAVFQKSIIDFFPSPQMRDAFVTRITEDDTYLHSYPDQNHFNQFFNYDFGCGEVRPAYSIQLSLLLERWRKKLGGINAIREETFDPNALRIKERELEYKGITTQKIIFCDGVAAATNPLFELLPFSPNKGEALLIESADLSREHIFKRGLTLAPYDDHLFWIGSNYQWEFKDDQPSQSFYESTKHHLEKWLRVPFKIVDHKAAVRPATLERRPFVGFHPVHPSVGIFNGMGTKGTSLAPYFAHQLVEHLLHGASITAEADVQRFSRILSK